MPDHAVSLQVVRDYEFLLQSLTGRLGGEVEAGKHEAIAWGQKLLRGYGLISPT